MEKWKYKDTHVFCEADKKEVCRKQLKMGLID